MISKEQIKSLDPEQIVAIKSEIYDEVIWIGKAKFVFTNFNNTIFDDEDFEMITREG